MTNEQSQKKSAHRVPPYRRPVIIAVFFIIIIITAIITIILLKQSKLVDPTDPEDSTIITNNHTGPSNDDLQKVVQYEGEDPNNSEELTGFIPYKGIDVGILTINVAIDQYLTSQGTCKLSLTNEDGQVYTATSSAMADITSSICEPFSIATDELSDGHWDIEVTVEADDKKGTIKDSDGVDI